MFIWILTTVDDIRRFGGSGRTDRIVKLPILWRYFKDSRDIRHEIIVYYTHFVSEWYGKEFDCTYKRHG